MTRPETDRMNAEEQKSLTHGEFWIPETERQVYRLALDTLNQAAVPCVVSGLYAIHAYTGLYRKTKDLDLLMEPRAVVAAARALKDAGFRVNLVEAHWLAKALQRAQIDLIFGMANGIGFIDRQWYEHSRPGILAGAQVRVAPPEELIWHRLFIGERHRFDMADVVHVILHRGAELDWDRLMGRAGDYWRLLLSQLHFFDFVYPDHRDRIPASVRRELQGRAGLAGSGATARVSGRKTGAGPDRPPLCRGTMLSRFSFAVDVNDWGFRDERVEHVAALQSTPVVAEIRAAEVWDERP